MTNITKKFVGKLKDTVATKDIVELIDADITVTDKAYEYAALERKIQQNNNVLLTPLKNKKGWQAMLKKQIKLLVMYSIRRHPL